MSDFGGQWARGPRRKPKGERGRLRSLKVHTDNLWERALLRRREMRGKKIVARSGKVKIGKSLEGKPSVETDLSVISK